MPDCDWLVGDYNRRTRTDLLTRDSKSSDQNVSPPPQLDNHDMAGSGEGAGIHVWAGSCKATDEWTDFTSKT